MVYHTSERLYEDVDGNLCAEDDPNVYALVAPAGGELTDDVAARYGLKGGGVKFVPAFHDNTLTPRELKVQLESRTAPGLVAQRRAEEAEETKVLEAQVKRLGTVRGVMPQPVVEEAVAHSEASAIAAPAKAAAK